MDFKEEASRILSPIRWGNELRLPGGPSLGREWWNNEYFGTLRSFSCGFPIRHSKFKILSISSADHTAKHDWRDFQQLKTMIVGAEWEGLELYPAESRLIDPSNRFYLWCVPKGIIKWGLPGNRMIISPNPTAPQREYPDGYLPKEPPKESSDTAE